MVQKQKPNCSLLKITPISTKMPNVMKIRYRTMSTQPTDLRSLNFAINKVNQRKLTAKSREVTTKAMPLELIGIAVSCAPWPTRMRVLISHGVPSANNIAKELAPSALDTPTPPSPVIKIHVFYCIHTDYIFIRERFISNDYIFRKFEHLLKIIIFVTFIKVRYWKLNYLK